MLLWQALCTLTMTSYPWMTSFNHFGSQASFRAKVLDFADYWQARQFDRFEWSFGFIPDLWEKYVAFIRDYGELGHNLRLDILPKPSSAIHSLLSPLGFTFFFESGDSDYQRIIWRGHPDESLGHYQVIWNRFKSIQGGFSTAVNRCSAVSHFARPLLHTEQSPRQQFLFWIGLSNFGAGRNRSLYSGLDSFSTTFPRHFYNHHS